MLETAVIIRDKTRLEQLIERFNSKAQAKFYIERSGSSFDFYEKEHEKFYQELNSLTSGFKDILKTKVIFRDFLPTYIFTESEVVVAIGQDGLIANTAKYLKGQALAGVNPDPESYDGVLLPFNSKSVIPAIKGAIRGQVNTKTVSLAKATLNDGQELLAFNDFYIGAKSHVSSRYKITFKGESEVQSSSGIIISTQAGSTGWLSSVLNMAYNVGSHFGVNLPHSSLDLNQKSSELIFTVREPFASVVSQTNIGFGKINKEESLIVESRMSENGVIFSDGVENDFLTFNTGSQVEISIASQTVDLLI